MPLARLFRDPIHGQIRYAQVKRSSPASALTDPEEQLSWLVQNIIDTPEFQRLRHVRQNGLANLVFHGAEHSRFIHSMGAAHVARQMYDNICRNMSFPIDPTHRIGVTISALLHDVGHGPFSHTIEEVLESVEVDFNHERMSIRYVSEQDSPINQFLSEFDKQLPQHIVAFIDKKFRSEKKIEEHWRFRLVSSQLDADRLDYLLRDADRCGLQGHGFDYPRLMDMLMCLDKKRIAVDRGAIEAVEAYLITLDMMYRAVYFHHAIRAATVLLSSAIRRAFFLSKNGDNSIFPADHPLKQLLTKGSNIDLASYARLGEFHVWALLDQWGTHKDKILADLSSRVFGRRLFKTKEVDPNRLNEVVNDIERAKEIVCRLFPWVPPRDASYYVLIDEPSRTSYKRYDWRSEGTDDSIWLTGGGTKDMPIEEDTSSKLVSGLKQTKYFPRLIMPEEVRAELRGSP